MGEKMAENQREAGVAVYRDGKCWGARLMNAILS
jgi:hypothetical protein